MPSWFFQVDKKDKIDPASLEKTLSRLSADLNKENSRRITGAIKKEGLFIKVFRVEGISDSLRFKLGIDHPTYKRRYGDSEYSNARKARKKGVPTPEVYAFAYNRGFFTRYQAVIYENLCKHRSLAKLLTEEDSPKTETRMLDAIYSAAKRIALAGFVHADFSAENILLDAGLSEAKVIDMEYALFTDKAMSDIMAFLFGYIYKSSLQHKIQESTFDSWFYSKISCDMELDKHSDSIKTIYEKAKTHRYSRADIYSLFSKDDHPKCSCKFWRPTISGN